MSGISLTDTFWFGKYKGQTIQAIIDTDSSYVFWAAENVRNFTLDEEARNLLAQHEDERLFSLAHRGFVPVGGPDDDDDYEDDPHWGGFGDDNYSDFGNN